MNHILYVLYDDNKIVYIGRTNTLNSLTSRLYSHSNRFKFNSFVCLHIGDRDKLLRMEKEKIIEFKPIHNIYCGKGGMS